MKYRVQGFNALTKEWEFKYTTNERTALLIMDQFENNTNYDSIIMEILDEHEEDTSGDFPTMWAETKEIPFK